MCGELPSINILNDGLVDFLSSVVLTTYFSFENVAGAHCDIATNNKVIHLDRVRVCIFFMFISF